MLIYIFLSNEQKQEFSENLKFNFKALHKYRIYFEKIAYIV